MHLRVIGSSPAWPNPGGACSSYLVDERVLLDCGPGSLAKLREGGGWPAVEAIVITHLHLDHWGDLVPWVWGSLFGPGREAATPELWLPPGAVAELGPILARLGSEDMFDRAFHVEEYEAAVPFDAAGLSVTAVPVLHYDIDAYGFRVQGDRLLGYSGDSGPCGGLGEIAAGADLFICEATLERAELDGELRGHLTPEEAREAGAGAARILLTHRPAELSQPDGELARDGLELDV